ncbi:protein EPIDERMAL PATTERNING FACTOR 2-like isoform X1 [Oryza glaberrima]|uniref:Epidermal patterning factor-like protein n=1 Tax=Oryza glaberrima TaxID=4538 RepID=I1PPQ3_ORYGL|nr:protein EPIDERMAL PATTERNING FACTOR 2-like isoform X1 [Oryza glaberrima]
MRRHATLADARGHHRILLILAVVLLLAATGDGIRSPPFSTDDVVTPVHGAQDEKISATATLVISPQQATAGNNVGRGVLQEEVRATGSSLPDCSHACGACSPCNRVMVSFKCSIAEPCPMVYRCMCKGKCYPVPSS